MWIYYILSVQSPADGHLGCFHLFAIMDDADINICVSVDIHICVQVSAWAYIFILISFQPRNGIAR